MGWTGKFIDYIKEGEAEAFIILDQKIEAVETSIRSFLAEINQNAPLKSSVNFKIGQVKELFEASIEIVSYKGRFFLNETGSDLFSLLDSIQNTTLNRYAEWVGVKHSSLRTVHAASYGCF